ncbi:UxaA family hydrolase [Neobacillus rhizophilus]|uniref:UxaA family hydrolase n=1 Tax=Neobacillus rhizophilus TaxID=2833579 RepID=A0A942Z004_9BACI|nr:UxaA family hydrolase [Neobacillus rhizophilus]MBS4216706.1 UxaA family hydrolase [Neobacillus rhizophilus]MBU8920211.1 UxaA family hydrolase [Bacillus sp. FJAT-29953]
MSRIFNALKLNKDDNVAVALRTIKAGEDLSIQGETATIKVMVDIPFGHKIATDLIQKDGKIIKYGECMGISTEEIEPGYHVHVFNVRGLKEDERLSALQEVRLP